MLFLVILFYIFIYLFLRGGAVIGQAQWQGCVWQAEAKNKRPYVYNIYIYLISLLFGVARRYRIYIHIYIYIHIAFVLFIYSLAHVVHGLHVVHVFHNAL